MIEYQKFVNGLVFLIIGALLFFGRQKFGTEFVKNKLPIFNKMLLDDNKIKKQAIYLAITLGLFSILSGLYLIFEAAFKK